MTRYILFVILILAGPVIAQQSLSEFYLKRNLKQEGQQFQFSVLEDGKHGVWFYNKQKFYFWYRSQQVISTQGASSGTLLNGAFEAFFPNKQLSQKGSFKKGLKHGEWLYWRKDGTLRLSEEWHKGAIRIQQQYNENGQPIKTISTHGSHFSSAVGDTLIVRKKRGRIEHHTIRNSEGQIVQKFSLKNGLLHGKKCMYEAGKLTLNERYKKGVLVEKPVKEKSEKAPKEKASNNSDKTKEKEKKQWFKTLFKRKKSTAEQ